MLMTDFKRVIVKITAIKYNPINYYKNISCNNGNVAISNNKVSRQSNFNDNSYNFPSYNQFLIGKTFRKDNVSFSSKNYDISSITNPTNHCAYCGCKLYNETQIDSIAKEILNSKAGRLEGKVRSVLEKLSDAKHSQEIAVAKRIENKDEIDFFNNFLDIASKKSFLKGEEIFLQVYHQDSEQAQKTLVKNMHPLLKTVDHVSPQREDKDNCNTDINLVEACSCCNGKLKKGISFNEFYAMFPTIKNNMPKEKFQYAMSQVLDTSQNQVLKRLSAVNMLKFLERLFVQRTETQNALDSVDYRIKDCKSGIQDSIEKCNQEIAEKQQEKSELEAKFEELKKDSEYVAMLKRSELQSKLDAVSIALDSNRARRTRLNDSINSLKSPQKKNKKKPEKASMTDEEKAKKIEQYKSDIQILSAQIEEQENQKFEFEIAIEELNTEFPTIEMLQMKKSKADSVINTHATIEKESKLLQERQERLSELETEEHETEKQIEEMPESSSSFILESYTQEEQETFKHYNDLVEARTFIEEHPNGGSVKIIINSRAKAPIDKEISELEEMDIIKDYKAANKRKGLNAKLERIRKNKHDVIALIHNSEKSIKNCKRTTEYMTREEAEEQSSMLSEKIKNLTEKQGNVRIPQIIVSIEAEILMLTKTIEDLIAQQKKIEEAYSTT